MRWAFLFSTVLAASSGCYAPSVAQGVPCDITHPVCPDGQRCHPTNGGFVCTTGPVIDAPVLGDTIGVDVGPDGPPGDLDGDGIPDAIDNCPTVSNSKQYDEDNDGIGDRCDKCPIVADATDPDRDHDGVGDACDPNPQTIGDQLWFFDGMHDLNNWATFGGWSASFGTAKADVADGNHATLRHSAAPTSGTVRVSANYKVNALHDTSGYGGAGVVDLKDPNGDAAIACATIETLSAGGMQETAIIDTGTETTLASTLATLVVGDTYTVTQKRSAGSAANQYRISCTMLHNGDLPVIANRDTATSSVTSPELGFRVRGASVAVNWFMVITSP